MRKPVRGEYGFTIIEMVVVIMIIVILVSAAITTFLANQQRMKLQADVRELLGTLQLARMRAISTGKPHGVAFWRREGQTNGNLPDSYFVFIDCNENYTYDDDDDNPVTNTTLTSWDACNGALTHDPRPPGGESGEIKTLNRGIYFTEIVGWKSKADSDGSLEYVVFNRFGQIVRSSSTNIIQGFIYLQNHRYRESKVDRSGLELLGGSGQIFIVPTSVVEPNAWR